MRYIFCLRYLLVLFVLLCTACGTALPTVKPYKLDVQQGNVVTSKMLLQLRPGMTKSQVRFIMGTPLIQDSFHGNRWDYVYQLREKGKIIEQRRVILDFENELLKAVRGDVIPAGSGPKGEETSNTGTRTVPVDKAKDKRFIDKLKFWKKEEVAPAPITPENQRSPVAPQAAPAPVTSEPAVTSPAEPSQPVEEATPVEAPKSILTVPMEVPAPPAEPAPSEAVSPPTSDTAPAPAEPAANTRPAETTQSKPSAVPEEVPSKPSDTPSIQEAPPETSPSVVKPASAPPARVDNQKAPAPKDLPEEGDPDFFERMLEKIGF